MGPCNSYFEEDYFKTFSNKISNLQGSENFILIGDSFITIDDTEMNFEIYCRYNPYNPEAELEILFNDVTRAKTNEKHKAEYKYKTLFLSKVAHEFKNPLICISELIDQSIENLPKEVKATSNISTNLKQIKALSSYLHILIKDLNFYSQSSLGSLTTLDRQETNLFDLIDFCKNITNTLIFKSNKSKAIDLLINIDRDVPQKIITDESRLKQLLINLLSNAVKFTLYGHILLDVSIQKCALGGPPLIKFMIKDTGVGIKADNFEELINSIKKEKNEDEGGSFGLAISHEIAQKLGKGLQFKSQYGHGTNFWFLIEDIEDKLKFTLSYNKCKSCMTLTKKLLINSLESSRVCFNREEEMSFTKNLHNLCFEEKKFLSRTDSQQTNELDNFCLVKPKNHFNKNYSSSSDSSDSEDEEQTEGSQKKLNISNISKSSNNPSLIFNPENPPRNEKRKSSLRLSTVKLLEIFYLILG
jgi:signal transduction histidine kinase